MSKEELNSLQTKLKAAIQNHQVVIVKLRTDPKNEEIVKELRAAQHEIQTLSERQKRLVVTLRKQLTAATHQISKKSEENRLNVNSTPEGKSKQAHLQTSHAQKQHTPRPSIMQGRRSVLRIQNEVPVNVKPPPPEGSDIRRLLRSSMQTELLSAKELQKVEYMASLNLVTRDRLKQLERRRGERRRRSTAVPQFSYVHGHLYPESSSRERKRPYSDDLIASERKRGRATEEKLTLPSTPSDTDDQCVVCGKAGDTVPCHVCGSACHVTCVTSPMSTYQSSASHRVTCPDCQASSNQSKSGSDQSESLDKRHAFQAMLSAREEEKEKERNELEEKSKQLRESGKQLQEQALRLGNLVQQKIKERKELQQAKTEAESRVQQLKTLIEQFKSS